MDEARILADSLLAADPDDYTAQGWDGALAASRGDRDRALQTESWLAAYEDPYNVRYAILWRARIHAQLGDTEYAVRLLREAYTAGATFNGSFHADPFLEPLQGNSDFEEFMRPKG